MGFTNDAIAQLQARMQAGQYGNNPQRFQKMYNRAMGHEQNTAMKQAMMSNPSAVASWFSQQSPQAQANLLGAGSGGAVNTPWGTIGGGTALQSMFHNALVQGGLNGNALNQMINWNSYNNMPGGQAAKGIFDFNAGGGMLGGGIEDQFGMNPNAPGGSSAVNAAHPFNPGAYTGQTPLAQYQQQHPALQPQGTSAPGANQPAGVPGQQQGGAGQAVSSFAVGAQTPNAGSWNPYQPVYGGPAGSTGDWGAGINANGTPVNSGRFPTATTAQPNTAGGSPLVQNAVATGTGGGMTNRMARRGMA